MQQRPGDLQRWRRQLHDDGIVASLHQPQGLNTATATADCTVPNGGGTEVGSNASEDIDFEMQRQQQSAGAGAGTGRHCIGLEGRRKASDGVDEPGVFKSNARLPAHMVAWFDLTSLDSLNAELVALPALLATMGGGSGGATGEAKAATQQQKWSSCSRPSGNGELTAETCHLP